MPAGFVSPSSVTMFAVLTSAPRWSQVVGSEADWNIKGEASTHLNDRRLDLHRGRYDTTMLVVGMESKAPLSFGLDSSADPVVVMAHCASVARQKTMTTGISMAGAESRYLSTCPK